MWPTFIAAATAQQITLGADRVAVLDPGFAPTAVEASAGSVLDVAPSPPVLLLMGLRPGTSTLTVERADGAPATWTVRVLGTDEAPSGGPGLVGRREALALPVGWAAACKVPGTSGRTPADPEAIGLAAFGDRWLVWVSREARADIAFEDGGKSPTVLAVSTGPAAVAGPSCALPVEVVRLRPGEALELDVGHVPKEVWVAHPDVVHATAADGDRVRLTAGRAGTTTLAVRGPSGAPVLRSIVVTAAPAP